MKTSLNLDGPVDLSVGRIRISGSDGVLRDWMATPGQRGLQADDIAPGFYMAEITPAGAQPQSVVFEVNEGETNAIKLPDFSALAANGASMTFLGSVDRLTATRSLFGFRADLAIGRQAGMVEFALDSEDLDESTNLAIAGIALQPISAEAQSDPLPHEERLLSVAIAMERRDRRESWADFPGTCSARISNGLLQLDVQAPPGWDVNSGQRVRLSVSIQDLRIERLLLPLYRGGTTIAITPSPLSANDVGLEVTPSDPAIRAIWRALDAGTSKHAEAVRDHVLHIKGPQRDSSLDEVDPWEAVLVGLLYLRFPEVFGTLSRSWTSRLVDRYPWMADCFIIQAKQVAATAAEDPAHIARHAEEASRLLVKAHACNSPYFSASNLYFKEMVESLAEFEGLAQDTRKRILRSQRRWQRELPLQRHTEVSFSWLSRDQALLKEKKILAPTRRASGRLPKRNNTLVFEGRITGGLIDIGRPGSSRPPARAAFAKSLANGITEETIALQDASAPALAPALMRPPGPPDDPNFGRFGKNCAVGGFSLAAQFLRAKGKYVPIVISVTASSEASLEVGDSVWLCLHPTFKPQWLRLYFNGRTATQTVRAWGGFTVGAWLPNQQIELECDLSQLPDAPRVIREN